MSDSEIDTTNLVQAVVNSSGLFAPRPFNQTTADPIAALYQSTASARNAPVFVMVPVPKDEPQ